MLPIAFQKQRKERFHVLCLGAHSDDIEIGCGGALLQLCRQYPNLALHWIVFSAASEERRREALLSARRFLPEAVNKTVVVKEFEDSFFPYQGREIKNYFRELGQELQPDLVFTHCRHDLHQDHRLLCELTWNTFRNQLILEYEIPKYDGDLRAPNFFVPLSAELAEQKVTHLCENFASQRAKPWFTAETFRALLRLRGVEAGCVEKYAEGFYCRKMIHT